LTYQTSGVENHLEANERDGLVDSKRGSLSRDLIIETAARLVDREGLEALTMRRLAGELGVKAMSLYNHVPNRTAILYGLVELLLAEIKPVSNRAASWQERLQAAMSNLRRVGLAHPHIFVLMLRPWRATGAQQADRALQNLLAAGFNDEEAGYALRALMSYVIGFGAWETARMVRDPQEIAEAPSVDGIDAVAASHLEAMRSNVVHSPDAAFEFGLRAIIAGLEQSLRTGAGRIDREAAKV
jgi:AcrR family transcriptional regulator